MKRKTKTRTRIVGGKHLTVRDDETFVGRRDEWLLIRIEGWCTSEWISLKLFRNEEGPKNLWQIGINKEFTRFAQNRDIRLLQEHHPEIADWAFDAAKEHEERRAARMAGGSNG